MLTLPVTTGSWVVLENCAPVGKADPSHALTSGAGEPGMRLVFDDEFDSPGRPDPAKWGFETGFVRNNEAQWYRPENARCEGGLLVIQATRERVRNAGFVPGSTDWRTNREFAEYASASVTTKGKWSYRYGRVRMRARP